MQGRFDLVKRDSGRLTDADFLKAKEEGCLQQLLEELPLVQRYHAQQNRIFDNMSGYLLDKLFSLPNCAAPYYYTDYGPQAALAFICLLNLDGDTDSYTEDWVSYGVRGYEVAYTVGSSAAKRFEEDQIEAWSIWSNADGRKAINFKNKWLYLPTQAVSSHIRSIGIFFRSDADGLLSEYYNRRTGRIGRVRLKDETGKSVIVTKNSREVLLVEYTFTLVSV